MNELLQLINRATIETRLLPPIVLDRPFAPGPPNQLLELLKPKITLRVGGESVSMAPYGEPGPSRWPVVAGALALGAGVLVLWTMRRRRR